MNGPNKALQVLMSNDCLVIGIHREELSFGEHVAEQIDNQRIHVLRIPQGISRQRNPNEDLFYYTTRHREIYLQLRQQIRGRYGLVIDLHSGINDSGRCADVYCHDETLLDCLDCKIRDRTELQEVKTAQIVADMKSRNASPGYTQKDGGHFSHAVAHTLIPEEVWNNRDFLYVGLEIYLKSADIGTETDWKYARILADLVLNCAENLTINQPSRSSFWA